MRKLPIYFLVDVSESMIGEPIKRVEEGMRMIIQDLRVDPYALETVFVSIIAFAGKAETLVPMTELFKFYPPVFPIGGGTALGRGLECLMDDIDKNVQRTTMEEKGDWKPIIFLFTDGNPTDDYSKAFRRWNERYRRHCNLVAVSIGDNVNVLTLAQITDDILLLKKTDQESFRQFFKWVTASIKTSSMSVSEQNDDGVKLAPTHGINLDKVEDPEAHRAIVDENFVVLHGRCQYTKNDYLIKYGRGDNHGDKPSPWSTPGRMGLIGAYPIDKEVYARLSDGGKAKFNSRGLIGVPTCPCCGSQNGAVVCECGNIFCVGENTQHLTCPWCGMEGSLGGHGGEGGIDLSRGLG